MSADPPFSSALVIGLGLIGGSLARDLIQRGVKVLGHDRDAATITEAEREGVVPVAELAQAAGSDVVIFATPVHETLALLPASARWIGEAKLVTDVCSTKASIVSAAEHAGIGNVFVGAHPMAGDNRTGWRASRRGLFRGARTYLCPAPAAQSASIELAEQLWKLVGALTERIDARNHDREVALTSHLPHLISAALAATLADERIERARLGPGGRDLTRLAGGDDALWTGIAIDNRAALATALDALQQRVSLLRDALERNDRPAVERELACARAWFHTPPLDPRK